MKKTIICLVMALLAVGAFTQDAHAQGNGLAKPLVVAPFPMTARTLKGAITTTTTTPHQLANEGIAEAVLLDDPYLSDCFRTVKSVRAYVHFHAGGSSAIYEQGKQAWTSTVRGNIFGVEGDGTEHQLTTSDVVLTIDQSHPEEVYILQEAAFVPEQHPYHSTPNAVNYEKVIFKIKAASGGVNGFDASSVASVNAQLVLSMCINDEVVYDFSQTASVDQLLRCDVDGAVPLGPTSCSPALANKATQKVTGTDVTLKWMNPRSCAGAMYGMYEVEILRLYNIDATKSLTPTEITAEVDWNAAIRYTVMHKGAVGDVQSLKVIPLHSTGYYVWRVRPVTTLYDGQANNPLNLGPWSESPAQMAPPDAPLIARVYLELAPCDNAYSRPLGPTTVSDPYRHIACFYFEDEDATRSYAHGLSIANDTSRTSVIMDSRGYVDALGRVVQSQILDRSNDIVLGGQAVFDRNGRPSLRTMSGPMFRAGTTPTYASTIKYNQGALRNTSGDLYTTEKYDDIESGNTFETLHAAGTFDGLGSYYSDANIDLTVPGADGYPFTRTVYNSDGRYRATIPPGSVHRGGTRADDRSTRTLTSSVGMSELLSIFGKEAPNAENVTKIISISPDGFASGSYVNTEGQLLASFMIGGPELADATNTTSAVTTIIGDGTANLLNANGMTTTTNLPTDQSEVVNTLSVENRFEGGVRMNRDTVVGSTRFALASTTTVEIGVKWKYNGLQFGSNPNEGFCLNQCVACQKTVRLKVIRVDCVPATVVLDQIVPAPTPTNICSATEPTTTYTLSNLSPGEYVVERIVSTDDVNSTTRLSSAEATVISVVTQSAVSTAMTTLLNTLFTTSEDPQTQLNAYNAYIHPAAPAIPPTTISVTLPASGACFTVPLPDIKKCHDCSKYNFEEYVEQRYLETKGVTLASVGYYEFYFYVASGGRVPKYEGTSLPNGFNAMITDMLANCDYDCQKLYGVWKTLVDERIEMLKIPNVADQVLPIGGDDIVERFLDIVGRKCMATTDVVTEYKAIKTAAEAAVAYKHLRTANTTKISDCVTLHTHAGVVDWVSVNACLNWELTTAQRTELEKQTGMSIPKNVGEATKLVEMNEAGKQKFTDECKKRCEDLRPEIERQVRASMTSPTDGEVYCRVQAIVDDCITNCALPLATEDQATQLAKATRIKAQMFGSPTVTLPDDVCPTGSHMIGGASNALDLLIKYLNNDYKYRQQHAVSVECVNYAVLIRRFLNDLGVTVPACVTNEALDENEDELPVSASGIDCSAGETTPPTNGYRFRLRVIPRVPGEFYRPNNGENCVVCGMAFRGPKLSTFPVHPWVDILNTMMNSLWGADLRSVPTPEAGTSFLSDSLRQPRYEVLTRIPTISMTGATDADSNIVDSTWSYLALLNEYSACVNGAAYRGYLFSYGNIVSTLPYGPMSTPVGVVFASDNSSYRLFDTTNAKHGRWRAFGSFGIQFQDFSPMVGGTDSFTRSFLGWSLDPSIENDSQLTSITLRSVAGGVANEYIYPATDSASEFTSIADSSFTQRIGMFQQDEQARLSFRDLATNTDHPIEEVKFYANHVRYLLGVVGDQDCSIPQLCTLNVACPVCVRWDTIAINTENAPDRIGPIPCELEELNRIKAEISRSFNLEIEKLKSFVRAAYERTCRSTYMVSDPVTVTYPEKYYHYTLYYYDRAGRLVRTVSPKGVSIDPTRAITATPAHTFVSRFKTNSRGQVQVKMVPDGGKEQYFYDASGRLRFVADAVQSAATPKRMSYIRYDALGRTVETGEVVLPTTGTDAVIATAASANAGTASWPTSSLVRNDVVHYFYDEKASSSSMPSSISNWTTVHTEQPTFVQKNVRGRLSFALSVPTLAVGQVADETATTTTPTAPTVDVVRSYFSYDAQGALVGYVVDIPVDNTTTSDRLIKQTAYQYDGGTGAVKQVDYQPKTVTDKHDRFIHRYHYDAMGRMDTVRTSPDGVLFDTDASYTYYKHGPLKREVIGEDMVQGRDYVYTLLGQIKGINHPTLDPSKDPGGDDGTGHVAKDAFAMGFSYYAGDFDRSVGSATSPFNASALGMQAPAVDLYSGLIGGWVQNTALMTVPSGQTLLRNNEMMGESFRYDVLGRLKSVTTSTHDGTQWVSDGTSGGYSSLYTYDQNSNLRRIGRYTLTSATTGTWLDDATTTMLNTSSNVVEEVTDVWTGLSSYPLDLAASSTANNAVDPNGNVIIGGTDANQTSADYTSIDRPKSETLRDGTVVEYLRDPFGRVVRQKESLEGEILKYWSLGPIGEIQAAYADEDGLELRDKLIYGMGRIGSSREAHVPVGSDLFERTVGSKLYECTDQLGSVKVLVSDVKIVGTSELLPDIVATADYEAYGLVRPFRSSSSLTTQYDFGFQGMRKTVSRFQTNEYTTEFRQYDAALGRWNGIDPIFQPGYSGYEGLNSAPSLVSDPLGLAGEYTDPESMTPRAKNSGVSGPLQISPGLSNNGSLILAINQSAKGSMNDGGNLQSSTVRASDGSIVTGATPMKAPKGSEDKKNEPVSTKILAEVSMFVVGAVDAIIEDQSAGGVDPIDGETVRVKPKDFRDGQVVGHFLSIVFSLGEILDGTAKVGGGGALTLETVGALSPVGAIAIAEGFAEIGHGIIAVTTATENVYSMATESTSGSGNEHSNDNQGSGPSNEPNSPAQRKGKSYKFPNKSELSKRLGVTEREFHKTVKKEIVDSFRAQLKKANIDNPDIGFDEVGNIVLKQPGTNRVLETGVSLELFKR